MRPAPEPAGATETFGNERGSASKPALVERELSASASSSAPLEGVTLDAVQRWFGGVVMDPRDLDAALRSNGLIDEPSEVDRVLTRGPQLSARQRLSTYRHGYRARLVECLVDDYPAVQYAVSEAAFEVLALDYIEHHPSRSPNLNFFGRHFADHLRKRKEDGFLVELSVLEWTMVEVLHAPMAAALTPETLATIPAADWPRARLPRAEAARLLRFGHPVNAYFQGWRTGAEPARPAEAASATLVYRHDLTLWRLDLPQPMAGVLEALFAGANLGDALATLETTNESEAIRDVMLWFREWVQGSIFARVVLEDG